MRNIELFDEDEDKKNTYGKYRNVYIPLVNKKVICNSLDLDNDNSWRGRVYKKIIVRLLKLTNTKTVFQKVENLALSNDIKECFQKVSGYKYSAIYLGMKDISEYYIVQLMDENGIILGYGKIPQKVQDSKPIFKEIEIINYLNELNLKHSQIPQVLYYDEHINLLIQTTKENLRKDKGKINTKHIDFLSELYNKTNSIYKFKDSKFYNNLINIKDKTYNRELIGLSHKVLNKIQLEEIESCYSHGDFYISNIKWDNDNMFVYDWNDGDIRAIYYDLFHYIASEKIINKKINKRIIIKNILKDNRYIDLYESKNNINKNLRVSMFIYYLYEIIYKFAIEMKLDVKEDRVLINYIETLNILLNSI